MFTGNATLVIDLGNSETRFVVKVRSRVSPVVTLSNRYAYIPDDYTPPASYGDGKSFIFHTSQGNYAHGDLAEKEFSSYLVKPSSLQPKGQSETSVLAREVVMYYAMKELSKLVGTGIEDLDITWDISVLCPPIQMSLKHTLEGIFGNSDDVTLIYPDEMAVPINVNAVKVMPEGISAFFAIVFDKHKKVRHEFQELKNSSVLIVDVGAGTTDVCVIENFRAIEDTMDTYPIGGNNVYQQVGKILKADGRNMREDILMEGVVTGRVLDGNVECDISDKVVKVKEKISNALKANIRRSFESNLYDPRGIQYLLVVGGGALSGETPALGTYLLKAMKELSPNIELLDLPDSEDLRYLNVLGALTLSC